MRVKYVKTNDCVPLRELERQFYSDVSFARLKRIIERDGFKSCFPVRAIYNKRQDRYEVFDGIHRVKVAHSLGIKKIPFIDETGKYTRQQAIAEGIKANISHAYYNPMDLAKNLQALSESLGRVRKSKSKSFGRPETRSLSALADLTGMSEPTISKHLQLLRLPEDVQRLVGEGKLRQTLAYILLKLDGTRHAHLISKLAQEVVTKGISRNQLIAKVKAIEKTGRYKDELKICEGCKRSFTFDTLSRTYLCPDCNDRLHSGKLRVMPSREKARQTFLKVNNYVQKLEKQGEEVPAWLRERLEKLHSQWEEARGW